MRVSVVSESERCEFVSDCESVIVIVSVIVRV